MKIICIVGTRPNLIKIAPLIRAFSQTDQIQAKLIHTGQHYNQELSALLFQDLGLPQPWLNLEVGSMSDTEQMAEIMKRLEPVIRKEDPNAVLVVGDVNSTLAAALCAVKLGKKVIHVESGLRSFDRGMPEEINRLLTDQISDLLFATEPSAVANLLREGIAPEKIHLVGNVMIDTLKEHLQKAKASEILSHLQLQKPFALLTLHRPSNVDDPKQLSALLKLIAKIAADLTIVFPIHPRTEKAVENAGISLDISGLRTLPPVGYLDFLKLMTEARFVLTDSGGIQEETTLLGIPCLTLRNNTERPITVTEGTNQVVGTSSEAIEIAVRKLLQTPTPPNRPAPALWDGHAAERIRHIILQTFC